MSNTIPSKIEDLPNEIWLEIFDYFNWFDLFSSFYCLNKRIWHLLMCIKTLSVHSTYPKKSPSDQFKRTYSQVVSNHSYNESFNITKQFNSFSGLSSLIANTFSDDNWRSTDEFVKFIFTQHCPIIHYSHIQWNVLEHKMQMNDNLCGTFHFPLLRHLHVNKLPFHLAIQLLNQCIHLRSFSAILYDYPSEKNVTILSTQIPDRIRIDGLPLLIRLNLGEDDYQEEETSSTFLEFLLPCCPNLRTFNFNIRFQDVPDCRDKILDPNWWQHIFITNNRLNRIFLHFEWWTRDIRNNGFTKIQRFQ
ncbi:unnamed protein product, partial [Adineta ricciae]